LEEVFILPQPKLCRAHGIETEAPAEGQPKFFYWQKKIDKLSKRRLSWEEFLKGTPIQKHPALRIPTSKTGDTLLHLSILQSKTEHIQILGRDPVLKIQRNQYGLTALELAEFLGRKKEAQLLQPALETNFCHAPNVSIPPRESSHFENLEYLPRPVFENEEILKEVFEKTKKAKEADLISPEKIWMGIYFDKEIRQAFHPAVSVRYIDEKVGFGAFADERIPSCSFVGEYTGVITLRNQSHIHDNHYSVRYTVWDMLEKKYVLDGKKMGNYTRFINHSEKPNLSLQAIYWRGLPRMIFVALREIREGSQLTFDYGPLFWKQCCQIPKPIG